MPVHTSSRASTPPATARSTYRRESSSSTSSSPTWMRMGGNPEKRPWSGGASGSFASALQGRFSGLPPIRIHVGDDEVLLDDSRRYVERAIAAGVDARLDVWMGM